MDHNIKKYFFTIVLALIIVAISGMFSAIFFQGDVKAQTVDSKADKESVNIKYEGFRLVYCDGPDRSKLPGSNGKNPEGYIPCDFVGLMMQVKKLLNVAIIAGVLIALGMFTYAGFLYMKGSKNDVDRAKNVFQKVGLGFIIMLSAWFIVFQLLKWLTGDSGFTALLK